MHTSSISWSRILLEKLIGTQLTKKFPAFYGTWSFSVEKKLPLNPLPSQMNSVRTHTPCFLKMHLNIIILAKLRSPKWSHLCFLFSVQNLCASVVTPQHAACLANLMPLDLMTITIFGEQCKLWSCSCVVVHPPVSLSLRSRYSPQHPVLRYLNPCSSHIVR
jgi:hypothetical protein